MSNKIDESTLISISMVLSILGGAGFVTYIAFQGNTNAKAIEEIQKKQDTLEIISVDIAVIKTKLDTIEKNIERKR